MSARPVLDREIGLDDLADVRRAVEDEARALGVKREALDDLLLAVDEAVTNIILHGYAGERGPVELRVARHGDELAVVILDRAPVFDPAEASRPRLDEPLEARPFGGMGVFLVRRMTDDMAHAAREGGGNELRLLKRDAFETAPA